MEEHKARQLLKKWGEKGDPEGEPEDEPEGEPEGEGEEENGGNQTAKAKEIKIGI